MYYNRLEEGEDSHQEGFVHPLLLLGLWNH